ncbi:DUF2939 domain-containing protein [Burkholderia pseudomallei]|uniref:DUF2939 domain-containing protein n=1 Tax=Burkholderia pseudomallei TaxID=28450 RepID=UPI0005DC3F61|nr:DUF2939 domain-containing protein [Burkholderia pseudomallei]KYZ82409.1 membrane protein [Burkholderia pseudomallei]MBF3382590.1 DUF2939 domain-containing protein [Burkholderia pseudomallei]MBF3403838.1 DUF2939 domain-containing protein [Burkholderia pseudomallei]ONA42566.1 hypothetical protein AQ878_12035 [Burkholderia pseudomallei]CAJ9464205.1 transmembrane protein [Burkholderia pseudomallei]
MNSIARPRGRFLKPVAIGIALIVVAAVALYAYASPYLALRQMKQAIDARDAQAISVHVDFPALRISLKQQLTDELMRRIDAQKRDNPLAVLGAIIGSALVGPLVDAYATPDGVAALMSGLPPHARPGQRPPELNPPSDPASAAAAGTGAPPGNAGVPGSASGAAKQTASAAAASTSGASGTSGTPPGAPSATPGPSPQTSAGYRGFDEFVVTYRRDDGSARYAAVFRRSGIFGWKLSAIDLHDD